MIFAGIIFDSLMIDRLKQKWVVRFLFLLVFAISVCSALWPMGDPDLSKIESWMQYVANNPGITASNLVLPIITNGNIIYFVFTLAISFVFILMSIFYSCLYVGEKAGQGTAQSILSFFKRLPVLLAFYILLLIPSTFMTGIFPFVFAFVIPALYFAPIMIISEKKNPISAITSSYKLTRGAKFSVFWNILMLSILYWLAESLFLMFLPTTSSAGILIQGFFTAYFVLSYGRLNGAYYNRIKTGTIDPDILLPNDEK